MSRRGRFVWSGLDQSLSSATNFALTVMAARLLGPDGLGVVAVGFGLYVLALAFQRALISEPLVVASAAQTDVERKTSTRAALTMTILGGSTIAVLMATFGLAVPGNLGRALILFSPWILPGLLQDLWRSILFRDNREAAAAVNDGIWLSVMGVIAAATWSQASDLAVVGSWGAGATAGALLGFGQTRFVLQGARESLHWWRHNAQRLGKWLAAETVVYNVTAQAYLFILLAVLGPSDVGGLYAVQAAFAPLSLIFPTIIFPGLPLIVRELTSSFANARTMSTKFSILAVILATVYCAIIGLGGGDELLGVVFGEAFEYYGFLILPVAVQQIVDAGGLGPVLLLKASSRGRALFASRALIAPIGLTLAALAALAGTLLLVAWSNVITRTLALVLVAVIARDAGDRVHSTYPARHSP